MSSLNIYVELSSFIRHDKRHCLLLQHHQSYINPTIQADFTSDTGKFAMGSALYQIQNGEPKLIAYASKRLWEAARNYSITELELCGLAINIASILTS